MTITGGELLAVVLIALSWRAAFLRGVIALIFAGLGDREAEETVGLLLLLALLSPAVLGSLVASGVLLRRLRDRPAQAYGRLARRAPIWVAGVTFLASSAFLFAVLGANPDWIFLALLVAVAALILAYLYVGLAALLLGVLRAASWVEASEPRER